MTFAPMTFADVRFVHVNIAAPPAEVASVLRDPTRMPEWAPNFGHEVTRDGKDWIVQTRAGPFTLRMAPDNDLGVADQWVTPPGASSAIHNAVRVTENGQGSLVVFNLFRQEGFTDAQFDDDEQLVAADLKRLKAFIENGA